MEIMKVVATMSIVAATVVNFYVAGIMKERYGKWPWYNILSGLILLGTIVQILVES
jgi:hypothetical protein